MGPAKIKRWLEKNGVAVKAVEVETVKGSPVIVSYRVTTKAGKSGKVSPDVRPYELENLRRTFV